MSGYDPKRPRRAVSEEEPAPVDALIDLAAHDRAADAAARTRVVTAAPAEAATAVLAGSTSTPAPVPEVTATPDTPVVEGPTGDDDTARVVFALIGLGALTALGVAVVLRRRHRR